MANRTSTRGFADKQSATRMIGTGTPPALSLLDLISSTVSATWNAALGKSKSEEITRNQHTGGAYPRLLCR
jgi:hypothetical protein